MDVKQAVKTAKDYVVSLYDEEEITNVGLEEVEFNELSDEWRVTIGFSRPWDHTKSTHIPISDARRPRSYKMVCITDTNGQIVSLKDRILVDRIPVHTD
ncbi:MAG: hypothetical protein OXC95_14845 [Dehalococcoidia bacterium]|nr:hypothetical protein [Dehalococcoidia bacterium]